MISKSLYLGDGLEANLEEFEFCGSNLLSMSLSRPSTKWSEYGVNCEIDEDLAKKLISMLEIYVNYKQ